MVVDSAFWLELGEIVWINLLLSGDNALVIAMACRSLPPRMQKWGIVLGTLPAVVLRIVFSIVITWLTTIPFLKIAGGLLLIWIAYGLLKPQRSDHHHHRRVDAATIWAAARTIIIADAVMSLDNVVAIAAAARGNMTLLAIGLVISMPLVVGGAGLLTRLLARWPVLTIGGAALLGYIAGDLLVTDPAVRAWFENGHDVVALFPSIAAALALGCVGFALRQPKQAPQPAPAPARPRDIG